MTFARDVPVRGRQAAADRDRRPARPAGPAALVQQLGTTVGNRSLARLIATRKLARYHPRARARAPARALGREGRPGLRESQDLPGQLDHGRLPAEGPKKATAKLRHGKSIMDEVGKAFGKTFTVRMRP
jgi:hypothetical protein